MASTAVLLLSCCSLLIGSKNDWSGKRVSLCSSHVVIYFSTFIMAICMQFGLSFGRFFNQAVMTRPSLPFFTVSVPSRLQSVSWKDAMLSSNNVRPSTRRYQRTGGPRNKCTHVLESFETRIIMFFIAI